MGIFLAKSHPKQRSRYFAVQFICDSPGYRGMRKFLGYRATLLCILATQA